MPTYKEVFDIKPPEFQGIFFTYSFLEPPWDTVLTQSLDLDFYAHYGNKQVSPFIVSLLDEDGHLGQTNKDKILQSILNINKDKWKKLLGTLNLEYKPLENYDMTEEESSDDAHTGTVTRETTGDAIDQVYGYNSEDAKNSGKTTSTGNGTDTRDLKDTGKRTLTRHGNIGVTTSQQMLQSEREVLLWDFFRDVLYKDVAKVLFIPIY